MNMYEKALDTLFEKNVVNGQVPQWLTTLKMIFDWGKHFAPIIEKAQKGEYEFTFDMIGLN